MLELNGGCGENLIICYNNAMAEQYLTREKYEELKKELEYLKTTKRSEIAARLEKAKEFGDLSENSEYFEVRDMQAQVETRIAELDNLLKNTKIIEKTSRRNEVSLGSTVTVKKQDGTKAVFVIVGSNETNPQENKISNESPIGKALMGKKAGDMVTVETPAGKTVYTIVKIE